MPWLWFLTRNAGSRIFQQKTVPDILRQVLAATPAQTSFELTETHFARDYCVQYRETDFDFVSRLMEEEGICYFFRHEDGKHSSCSRTGRGRSRASARSRSTSPARRTGTACSTGRRRRSCGPAG